MPYDRDGVVTSMRMASAGVIEVRMVG
jgi:hypothetical protein